MYRVLKPGGRFMCLEFSKPTAPLFRHLYDFYSFRLMLIGLLFVGSRKAYTYLPRVDSDVSFPSETECPLEEIGFSEVSYRKLERLGILGVAVKEGGTGGSVSLDGKGQIGAKPAEDGGQRGHRED